MFSDHDVLIAGIRLPDRRTHEYHWRLPGRIPWQSLDEATWNSQVCMRVAAKLGIQMLLQMPSTLGVLILN